ncbi:MAG: AMP-binding protein [Acidimicrobiia bacterium]|jgi:fatty-acyl-CoA synthase
MAREWSLGDVHEVVASAIPERDMIVWGDHRRTFGEVAARSRALARFLRGRELGACRDRASLERWECGQDRVAVLGHNTPEHVEAILACWKARVVPCNVNYHYTTGEIADLLRRIGARVVVSERGLGDKLADIAGDLDLLVEIDDGSAAPSLAGAVGYEQALALGGDVDELPRSSPDDLHIACTGGTTGHPKAVLWRQADLFVAGMGGAEDLGEDALRERAVRGAGTWFPTSPLMHVAAQWTTFLAAGMGATVVLHDDTQPFDVRTILETAAREHVNMMTIVGDAYARPMIDELRRTGYDLSALAAIGTGGAPTSPEAKRALMELIPNVTIRDGYGASEIGAMTSGIASADGPDTQRFPLGPSARLLSADRTHFLEPGSEEIGWMARCSRVPLGYLDDEVATEATFPIVDGVRVAVPGDRARFTDDGQVELLGRDSLVVNTGGEKVFVEEVEEVLKRHADVVDVLVIGRPSERFGHEVTAIVQLAPAAEPQPEALREWCADHLARYKAPRAFVFVDRVQRHPSGKADYSWARATSLQAVGVR